MGKLKRILLDDDQIEMLYELLDGLEGDKYRLLTKYSLKHGAVDGVDKTCDEIHMINDIKAILKNVYEEKK